MKPEFIYEAPGITIYAEDGILYEVNRVNVNMYDDTPENRKKVIEYAERSGKSPQEGQNDVEQN